MIRGDEDITEGLLNAFRLEKGAHQFYSAAAERMSDAGGAAMFKKLASVEEKHMLAIYDLYNGLLGERAPVPFDEFREGQSASFTESGKSIEAALNGVESQFFMDARAVLNAALAEEKSARELYLSMAKRASDPSAASLYKKFSEDEEMHIQMVEEALKALG